MNEAMNANRNNHLQDAIQSRMNNELWNLKIATLVLEKRNTRKRVMDHLFNAASMTAAAAAVVIVFLTPLAPMGDLPVGQKGGAHRHTVDYAATYPNYDDQIFVQNGKKGQAGATLNDSRQNRQNQNGYATLPAGFNTELRNVIFRGQVISDNSDAHLINTALQKR